MSACTNWQLPFTRSSPPSCFFNFDTDSAASPVMTVVLFHVGFVSLLETTYFGIEFILVANPWSSVRLGQAAAKPSYVLRPRRRPSADVTSSNLNRSPSSPRLNWNTHPPCFVCSDPPGSSMTPSTRSEDHTTILPTSSN